MHRNKYPVCNFETNLNSYYCKFYLPQDPFYRAYMSRWIKAIFSVLLQIFTELLKNVLLFVNKHKDDKLNIRLIMKCFINHPHLALIYLTVLLLYLI